MDQKRQTVLQFCPCSQRCASGSQPSPTGALPVQSVVYIPPAHSHLQPELCPCSLRCTSGYLPPAHLRLSHLQPELCPCSLRCLHLRLTAISNRSSVRAVCGVYTSGSQPSPTGALSVQSAVVPAHSHLQPELCPCSLRCLAHSHLQPELCPCSLRCLHLRLTAISNRSSVRAVCGVYTSGSQPSPTGALSVQSAVFTPPAHSHLQPELCPCSLRCLHLRLTAISNRSSVRAVCDVPRVVIG